MSTSEHIPPEKASADKSSAEQSPLFASTLARGLEVIRAFRAGNPSMNLPEIAAATGMTKSAAQRFAFTLESLGYLRKDPQSKRYQLTPRALSLGFGFLQTDSLIDRATPYLHQLNRECHESCNLSEPDGHDMVFVARFPSHNQVMIPMPLGLSLPMYCTASGRAYLAYLEPGESHALLSAMPRPQQTSATITDLDELSRVITRTREEGYCIIEGEYFLGDISLAAPILDAAGMPLGAINISVPASRWNLEDARRELAPALIHTAHAISSAGQSQRAGGFR
ncbi:IclR family transcriptional regulator [Pseudomonas gingeri NCPPB 3146 = LMG 5327]|uniref:IclR family transcriptional regulator n=2 Tax=Pseudomonas gingeri TaxID=117681 RepID=A0A7Y7Y5U7_9PSED|nr:IclR family transcriptional regulator [Pseudomonas gingeri]NWC18274.1 IclR family transcriptional regulator [Pseudomonas gingeri]NWE46240.1 IclR family transcriptional regulator [Pseudomonas gingeri]PNQ90400.1 IclR family transcriptional regulator [Pseudomonas gingeri NCPPB 3146 = LMG 5327]